MTLTERAITHCFRQWALWTEVVDRDTTTSRRHHVPGFYCAKAWAEKAERIATRLASSAQPAATGPGR